MDKEDQESRWTLGVMGGKSATQKRLERELAEKRASLSIPKLKRKPIKWYWWVAISVGIVVWVLLAFWVSGEF